MLNVTYVGKILNYHIWKVEHLIYLLQWKGYKLVEERLTGLNIPHQTLAKNQKVSTAHFSKLKMFALILPKSVPVWRVQYVKFSSKWQLQEYLGNQHSTIFAGTFFNSIKVRFYAANSENLPHPSKIPHFATGKILLLYKTLEIFSLWIVLYLNIKISVCFWFYIFCSSYYGQQVCECHKE